MKIIQRSLNVQPVSNMGVSKYYKILYKFYFSQCVPKEIVQDVFNDALRCLVKSPTITDKNRTLKILNLCLEKGVEIGTPQFKMTSFGENELGILPQEMEIFENTDVFDFLINSPKVSEEEKCKLDVFLLQSMMTDLVLLNYKKPDGYLSRYLNQKFTHLQNFNGSFSALEELEKILHRGHVFNNQMSRFITLSSILTYRDIFDNLGKQFKLLCFHEFASLDIIGKKSLTSILIKNKNEDAIFNLLNFGLKLNWDIPIKDGRNNLVAFELLYSLPWVKEFINHPSLDIRLTNSHGENILHLIGACALSDASVEEALRVKLNSLSIRERDNLFSQINEDGFSPLMKAVMFQDEKLIDFILEFNIKPWDKIKGAPLYESALDLLNDYILSSTGEGVLGSLMGYFKESFWGHLAKKWNSEFNYLLLQQELTKNKIPQKTLIKI